MKKYKGLLIKYAVSFAVGALAALLILVIRDFWSISISAERMRALSDAFTIPGVVFLMVGVMVWVSTTGFFDILGFSLGRLGRSLIPFSRKTNESFYDYKTRKNGERIAGYSFIFVTGALLTAISIVFTVLYYKV